MLIFSGWYFQDYEMLPVVTSIPPSTRLKRKYILVVYETVDLVQNTNSTCLRTRVKLGYQEFLKGPISRKKSDMYGCEIGCRSKLEFAFTHQLPFLQVMASS